MATVKATVLRRKEQVKEVRKEFGHVMLVRKGWRYVICQCKGCRRMFQVPYKAAAYEYGRRVLRVHVECCQEL
jgi:hypothetical protein